MADIDIDELRKLLANATPGSWYLACTPLGTPAILQRMPPTECEAIAYFSQDVREEDMRLIVAAVNALPDYIACKERLERADTRGALCEKLEVDVQTLQRQLARSKRALERYERALRDAKRELGSIQQSPEMMGHNDIAHLCDAIEIIDKSLEQTDG